MSGVVGIKSTGDIAKELFYTLSSIQHRGQDAAGIVLSDGKDLNRIKTIGLVNELFDDDSLDSSNAHLGIGHVRSAPEGANKDYNVEPLVSFAKNNEFSIAHDGNLVNYYSLKREEEDIGMAFHTHTDSELILLLITRYYEGDIVGAIRKAMEKIRGAYSCVLCMPDKIVGFRDYYGMRPLVVGGDEDTKIIASENCAVEILDIQNYRDIEAGEIVVIDDKGVHSYPSDKKNISKHCIFEYVYTARPDANIAGINAYMFRRRCGEKLYDQYPVKADLVCPVPDSGTPSAIGFAQRSGIPFAAGLVKNRYMGRTFIKSSQEEREIAVRLKLNPQKSVLEGKSIVLVDDSIVRGTTSAKLIKRIRQAGAKEVHFRVTSPPFSHPCYYGVDTPDKNQLVASKMSKEEIRELIGADTLEFLSLENLLSLTNRPEDNCIACFTGHYPIEPVEIEEIWNLQYSFQEQEVI